MSQLPPQTVPYSLPPKPTSALAIVSLILGIISLIGCLSYVGVVIGIVAVVLGVLALQKVKTGEAGGGGLAKAGLVLGIIGVVICVGFTIAAHKAAGFLQNTAQQLQKQADDMKAQAEKAAHDAQQQTPTPPDTTTPPTTPVPATPPATTPGAMLTPHGLQWHAEWPAAEAA